MKRMQVDGEQLVGRIRRDAQSLLKRGRAEIARDVRGLTARADKTLRTFETRLLRQMHAATTEQVGRVERRMAKLERSVAEIERRLAVSTQTAA